MGIRQAQNDIASYYILGYYSNNAKQDGKYRRIKVKLNGRRVGEARLPQRLLRRQGVQELQRVRQGTPTRGGAPAGRSGDRSAAWRSKWITSAWRKASYFVPVALKIPGSAVELRASAARTIGRSSISSARCATPRDGWWRACATASPSS